jgi:hypothetical protein
LNAFGAVVVAGLVDMNHYWPAVLGDDAFYVAFYIPFLFMILNMVTYSRAASAMRDLGYEDIWTRQMSAKVGTANFVASVVCYGVAFISVALYAVVASTIHLYIVGDLI